MAKKSRQTYQTVLLQKLMYNEAQWVKLRIHLPQWEHCIHSVKAGFPPVKDHYSHCYQSYAPSGGKKHLQHVRYHVIRVVLEI